MQLNLLQPQEVNPNLKIFFYKYTIYYSTDFSAYRIAHVNIGFIFFIRQFLVLSVLLLS